MTGSNTANGQPSLSVLLLISCTVCFVCFFGSYMRIPVVPLFASSLGADSVQVGIINGAFMLVAGALSIPSGLVSDRLGRRLPILAGLLLLSGSSFLLFWSTSPLQMAGIYLLFGVGLAAFAPTLMSYVADFTPPDRLGQAFGWYTMALYGGMTIGPATGGFLAKLLGLRQVFLVSGGLIFITFWVVLFFLPVARTPHRTAPRPAIIPSLKGLGHNRALLACLTVTIGTCMGFGLFVTFMPLYITSAGLNAGDVGTVFAAQALANALSRIPFGRLGDRVADRAVFVTWGLAGFSLTIAAFAFCTTAIPLMTVAAMMGISMGVVFTAIVALIADVVPRELRGLAMGCYNTCIYFGMMAGSAGMGTVIRSSGFKTSFLLTGTITAMVLVIFFFLYRRPAVTGAGEPSL